MVALLNQIGCLDPTACTVEEIQLLAEDAHEGYYPIYETVRNNAVSDLKCNSGISVVTDTPATFATFNLTGELLIASDSED